METDPKKLVAMALASDKLGGVAQAAEGASTGAVDPMQLLLQIASQSPEAQTPRWEEPYAPTMRPRAGVNVNASIPVGAGRAFINGMVERVKGGGDVKYAGGGNVGYAADLSPLEQLMVMLSGGGTNKDFSVNGAQVQYNKRF